jgi:hypothetical protein
MYVAARRYEGVRDSKKVAQLVDEGFVPLISEMPGVRGLLLGRRRGRRNGFYKRLRA